jgi:hypothetical protein
MYLSGALQVYPSGPLKVYLIGYISRVFKRYPKRYPISPCKVPRVSCIQEPVKYHNRGYTLI